MRYANAMWRHSISFKMLLAYVAGVLLSILLIASAALALIVSESDVFLTADVAERSHELANKLQFDSAGTPIGFDSSQDNRIWSYKSLGQEIGYRVLDSAANVRLTSTEDKFWPSNIVITRSESGAFNFEREGLLMYAATSSVEHDGRTWYLQFAASKRLMELLHVGFAWPFMGAGIVLFSLVLLFVFGGCAYVTLGYTLKPLREVSESAAAISPRSLHSRLAVKTVPSEIAPLVASFNHTLERLEHGYRVQQDFLATAAHELKTPLALIRAQIELMEQSEGRSSLLSDVAHMTRQVQQLLLLAEASEVQNYSLAAVNTLDVANEAIFYLRRMADAAGVRLILVNSTAALCLWQADRSALFTLLKNLLENAIQHAPRGTEVHVTLDENSLTVRDWGAGVGPEQLSQVFARFWRGSHRRDHGAGLGLTICQEIARAHRWTLSARRAEPGLIFCLCRSES
ncbi:Signal transduction histidine kinase [Pseudomonas sp. 43mfcvi1.1]|uniref:sensor histidine kinase n=1 Tax=unclassified Pseudomonas TaxID=196821 RepID=UPI000D6BD416|nr:MULTISPECIES: ATP-binding protein [unclassified Pseudomonas]PWJ35051.1 signal transduction histidine kinase [Pseudomonas sp. 43mfcvi1.1]BBH33395.1 histidine kinase, Classic [Pseudomonas sp. St290]SSB97099.1 Signal transduction histidine kinase [Pseudomonas sp. 43mfcvi1.1]